MTAKIKPPDPLGNAAELPSPLAANSRIYYHHAEQHRGPHLHHLGQPEWREAVRSVLLTADLLYLPIRFAEYAAPTDRRLETLLAEFIAITNQRLAALEAGQEELRAGQAKLEAGQQAHTERPDRLEAGQREIRNDIAPIPGFVAHEGAFRSTRRIARTMNCYQVSLINSDDLY